MIYLNTYIDFVKESVEEFVELAADVNILESIVTDSETLLKSIQAKEENLFTTFELNPDEFSRNFKIEKLYNSPKFNKKLTEKKLKKSTLEETEDMETFLENILDVKFFLIHEIDKSSLDKPEYIVFQSKLRKDNKWDDIKLYSVHDDIKNFYDRLTNKTIELKKDNKTYIYFTSNSGNNWQLQNIEVADDIFKDLLDNDEIKIILRDKDITITIIS
jgi:hypothetical protein